MLILDSDELVLYRRNGMPERDFDYDLMGKESEALQVTYPRPVREILQEIKAQGFDGRGGIIEDVLARVKH